MTSIQGSKPWAYDKYWGVSGHYVYDPELGARVPVHENQTEVTDNGTSGSQEDPAGED